MNDDQLLALLRDTPLPADPDNRYDEVAQRRRHRSQRRLAVVGATVGLLAIVGAITVATSHPGSKASLVQIANATKHAGTAHLVSVTSGAGQTGSIVGDIDFTHDRLEFQAASGEQGFSLRIIGRDMYVKGVYAVGAYGGTLPPGKVWVHTTDGTLDNLAGLDPTHLLSSLQKAKATLTADGTDSVEGSPTTRYRVTLPASALKANVFDGGSGYLFVDGNGVVRRTTDTSTAGGVTEHHVLTFSRFGESVTIEPPPAAQTVEEGPITNSFSSGTVSSSGSTGAPFSSSLSSSLSSAQCAQIKASQKGVPADQRAAIGQLLDRLCVTKK